MRLIVKAPPGIRGELFLLRYTQQSLCDNFGLTMRLLPHDLLVLLRSYNRVGHWITNWSVISSVSIIFYIQVNASQPISEEFAILQFVEKSRGM
jgi:hypothetical protein